METKKKKVSRLIFFSLILLNILVVLFLFRNRPNDTPAYESFIEENLKFNESQIKEYQHLINIHRKEMKTINRKIRSAKIDLYKELNQNNSNQFKINQKTNKLNEFQKELETLNFNHFLSIKQICSSKQLIEFKKISQEFTLFFKPN